MRSIRLIAKLSLRIRRQTGGLRMISLPFSLHHHALRGCAATIYAARFITPRRHHALLRRYDAT